MSILRVHSAAWTVSMAMLAGVARVAAAGPGWDMTVRSAYAVDEGHKWLDFHHNLSVTTHRRLNSHLGVLASVGYARDMTPLWLVWLPEVRGTAHREARLVPVALGLRYSPLGENAKYPQPFLEIAPALYWYHYEASVRSTDMFTGKTLYASDSFDHVAPGLQATAIVPIRLIGPVGIDMGVSYFFSDDFGLGERLLAGPEEGLNTLAATFGLWVRP
jgi:hypothetical protein